MIMTRMLPALLRLIRIMIFVTKKFLVVLRITFRMVRKSPSRIVELPITDHSWELSNCRLVSIKLL